MIKINRKFNIKKKKKGRHVVKFGGTKKMIRRHSCTYFFAFFILFRDFGALVHSTLYYLLLQLYDTIWALIINQISTNSTNTPFHPPIMGVILAYIISPTLFVSLFVPYF